MTTQQKQKLKTSDMGAIQADAVYGFEQFQKLTGQGANCLAVIPHTGIACDTCRESALHIGK